MTEGPDPPHVAVLGASGLIGHAIAEALLHRDVAVRAVARQFTAAQATTLGPAGVVAPLVDLDAAALAALLDERPVAVVLNCIGILQDGKRETTAETHSGFVARLLQAIALIERPILLIHVSIPGHAAGDRTSFSRTKREAETLIHGSAHPYVILRPGFVIAANAYGGSALLRALATLPLALPGTVATRPFAITAMDDLVETVLRVTRRWTGGERSWAASYDVMSPETTTVGTVLDAFRRRLGGPRPRMLFPAWMLGCGAAAGDLAGHLGWSPPIRTTALAEMLQGVEGDPRAWLAETGIVPATLDGAVGGLPSTIQDRWFARLFLLKPAIVAGLALFWIASGAIALSVAFPQAAAILASHGLGDGEARLLTVLTSIADLSVGMAIAWRRTCRAGLLAGIVLSLGYMTAAVLLTPDLWLDPLGSLVKTGPAILLMAVALAILPAR